MRASRLRTTARKTIVRSMARQMDLYGAYRPTNGADWLLDSTQDITCNSQMRHGGRFNVAYADGHAKNLIAFQRGGRKYAIPSFPARIQATCRKRFAHGCELREKRMVANFERNSRAVPSSSACSRRNRRAFSRSSESGPRRCRRVPGLGPCRPGVCRPEDWPLYRRYPRAPLQSRLPNCPRV